MRGSVNKYQIYPSERKNSDCLFRWFSYYNPILSWGNLVSSLECCGKEIYSEKKNWISTIHLWDSLLIRKQINKMPENEYFPTLPAAFIAINPCWHWSGPQKGFRHGMSILIAPVNWWGHAWPPSAYSERQWVVNYQLLDLRQDFYWNLGQDFYFLT